MVANYATVMDTFGMTPYEVWMKLSAGATASQVEAAIEENKKTTVSFQSVEETLLEGQNAALIQMTNSLFSMDFFLSLFLCVVGFLIYWIMSIRNRELLFGIYRAMGMQMREIRRMIFNEQMFGSVFPILAGIGVGAITTRLFVKLETLVYLPRKHNLAISVEISSADLGRRLALVSGMVVFCAFVLMRLMRKLKITQALKLGED